MKTVLKNNSEPTADDIADWRENPRKFLTHVMGGTDRWSKQLEIITSVKKNRETYVKSCHGVGKTFIAADVVIWWLLTHIPSKVVTTAPSWGQVEKLLWAEINAKIKRMKIPFKNLVCLKTELRIDDDWFAVGISPEIESSDEGKRVVGYHSPNLLVVFDEAPAVDARIWKIKEALMTSEHVRFLGIGNPVQDSGEFYDGFRRPDASKITMSIFESPNFKDNKIENISDLESITDAKLAKMFMPYPALTTPRWARDRLKAWGKDSPIFTARVLGEFPRRTNDTVISLGSVSACAGLTNLGTSEAVLGVDVARFGSDFTVLIGYHDWEPVLSDKWNGLDLVQTAGKITEAVRTHHFRKVVIDDTGLGGGVTDMLVNNPRLNDVQIIPVNFAEQAIDPDVYDGLITELYFKARDLVNNKSIRIDDDGDLPMQLTARKYKYTIKQLIKLESKDEYKKRTGLSSPDTADAFILCVHGLTSGMAADDLIASNDGALSAEYDVETI